MDAYTAVIGLATAADADHAGKRLGHHADLHSAITLADSSRAELILTLPADDLRHAADSALNLIKATGHRPLRLEVLLADEYDRRNRQ